MLFIAGALLLICNVYLVFRIFSALKDYTLRVKSADTLEQSIRKDLRKLEEITKEQEDLSKSKFLREKYLVEKYSIPLYKDEKIFAVPKENN